MSEKDSTEKDRILSGELEEIHGEKIDPDYALCFGEYGKRPKCPTCELRDKCKKFTEAERRVCIRCQGKYGHRGKKRKRDKY